MLEVIEWLQCVQILSAKLQMVTSDAEDLSVLFTCVKLSERLGNNQRSESQSRVTAYYSARAFFLKH